MTTLKDKILRFNLTQYARIPSVRILLIYDEDNPHLIQELEDELTLNLNLLKNPCNNTIILENGTRITLETNIEQAIQYNKYGGRYFHYILMIGYYDAHTINHMSQYLRKCNKEPIPLHLDVIN